MQLTDDEIIKKYENIVQVVIEIVCFHMNMNIHVIFVIILFIKTKEQLSNISRKKQNFALRLNYGKKKILTICVDVAQIYFGDDYNIMFEVLSGLKYRKLH